MTDHMQVGMAEAARLTRAGRLTEATAAIQRTLGSTPTIVDAATTKAVSPSEPIEAEFHVVDDSPLAQEKTIWNVASKLGVPSRPVTTPPASPVDVRWPGAPQQPGSMSNEAERARPLSAKARPSSARTRGQFVDGSYSSTVGTRTYKLYISGGYTGRAVPLIVMLHGCSQTPADFAAGTRMNVLAERETFLVVYPEQAQSANSSKCWNWFQAADQQRNGGEPSLIAGITRQIMRSYSIDGSRVYVAGLSAGGAMAAIMAATYPDLYAAVGVHSGLAYGAAHDLPSAFTAMKKGAPQIAQQLAEVIPMIVFHGDRDTTVATVNADRVFDQWLRAVDNEPGAVRQSARDVSVERGKVPRGYAYTRFSYHNTSSQAVLEKWIVHQAGHAWSGGSASGTYTDPKGPDASAEMVRFFTEHLKGK
ncbi:MAG: PHB depolymerase family esterase [Ktedonobacteraceae bacterium]